MLARAKRPGAAAAYACGWQGAPNDVLDIETSTVSLRSATGAGFGRAALSALGRLRRTAGPPSQIDLDPKNDDANLQGPLFGRMGSSLTFRMFPKQSIIAFVASTYLGWAGVGTRRRRWVPKPRKQKPEEATKQENTN